MSVNEPCNCNQAIELTEILKDLIQDYEMYSGFRKGYKTYSKAKQILAKWEQK